MTKKRTLSIGKIRALQRCSTSNNIFTILALDHQDSLRRVMKPEHPTSVSEQEIIAFKQDVVSALIPESSGVLLDPVYGAGQVIQNDVLATAGLLIELEKADYSMDPLPLLVEILSNWSVEKIKRVGGDGVKLFFYYNPDDRETVERQDQLISNVINQCDICDIPLFAEPILYPYPADSLTYMTDRQRLVIESAEHIAALGADVLKLEFPLSIEQHPHRRDWQQPCEDLTQSLDVPWVLLSAGVDFSTFVEQVTIACKAGASGFIGGRAVWGDACRFDDRVKRIDWLSTVGRDRMRELSEIARQHATAWSDYILPESVTTSWYQNY